MNTPSVLMHLAGLVPLSVLAWFLVLPSSGPVYRRAAWWPIAAVVFVPLGAGLGVAVAAAFNEPLMLPAISWIEQPVFAAQAVVTCAVIGGGWSYGMACVVAKVLRQWGWTNLPRQLLGT